ncbi:hypothetical protein BVC80_1837g84 [Macleaya cordata]|uniref:U-box domain-containing protein n=1 Tax=Macleaya cordata TaxID=56857 RepID=A0A200R3J2_MACCD|nr:hypothetical protein BVC80_1837g84 [Macleaya cordata]
MASEEMNLVTDQRMENGLNSQIVFQEENLQFNCGVPQRQVGDPLPERKSREVQNSDGMFTITRRIGEIGPRTRTGIFPMLSRKFMLILGSSRGLLVKDGNVVYSANNIRGGSTSEQQGRVSHYENAITIAEPETYYSHFLEGAEGQTTVHKETARENGCGFSSRKDESFSMESGESLKTILSDPVTGTLMDDAMILPCGHSFGSGGMQHVIRMKACYTCSQTVSEESVAANLSLRLAVQAFRQEEELQSCRVSRKRRERFEQDKSSHGDPYFIDLSRGKGVQFPFAVTDRVVIKGNKRTPLRFVGREAVVTTQCLNGWYVVKTLDNAESVKLQYRSLAKVSDSRSSNMTSSKTAPNWLESLYRK